MNTLPGQRNPGPRKARTSGAGTHVLVGDVAHVSDVGDPPVVVDHGDGDGVLADLGGHVPLHLEAQVLQNQVACKITGRQTDRARSVGGFPHLKRSTNRLRRGGQGCGLTCRDAVEQREHSQRPALVGGDGRVDTMRLLGNRKEADL